ncbi:MAG: sulfate adenylyltransferase subunit CysD [Aestuariivirga sp.]|uniref:sulfate adenylyltransferase subunit CysD n=1 Tax=Aestuariivirga sp. TaxID=2650926 RepID=UPI0038D0E682
MKLSHLDRLEAEAIHIIRETAAQFRKPVLLYSIGKDSTTLLHLCAKAFYPGKPPFPLLHIDSTWEFRDALAFRDWVTTHYGVELIVYRNEEGVRNNINPFDHGSSLYTEIMRTVPLKQAITELGFDAAMGGARRDEEKSRAKERIFSVRDANHGWNPKSQRPELWDNYNGRLAPGQTMRVFPISNWTELDIWLYILREDIPLPPVYFASPRPIVWRDGQIILVDDDRLRLEPGETPEVLNVRFRTCGCYPLTGGVVSEARDVREVILETMQATGSERQGRIIDKDGASAMEDKKRPGYF